MRILKFLVIALWFVLSPAQGYNQKVLWEKTYSGKQGAWAYAVGLMPDGG